MMGADYTTQGPGCDKTHGDGKTRGIGNSTSMSRAYATLVPTGTFPLWNRMSRESQDDVTSQRIIRFATQRETVNSAKPQGQTPSVFDESQDLQSLFPSNTVALELGVPEGVRPDGGDALGVNAATIRIVPAGGWTGCPVSISGAAAAVEASPTATVTRRAATFMVGLGVLMATTAETGGRGLEWTVKMATGVAWPRIRTPFIREKRLACRDALGERVADLCSGRHRRTVDPPQTIAPCWVSVNTVPPC